MQIFNIGVLEVVLILVLAFIILGPETAVSTARDIGRWVRKLVKSPLWRELLSTSQEIREFPKKVMDDPEFKKSFDTLNESTKEIQKELNRVQNETSQELKRSENAIDQALKKEPTLKKEGNEDDQAAGN
jgi:sec-independent protein translocase protein TatB